jgi:hypothetical protein
MKATCRGRAPLDALADAADALLVWAVDDDERILDVGIGVDAVGNERAMDVAARLQKDCASDSAEAMGSGIVVVGFELEALALALGVAVAETVEDAVEDVVVQEESMESMQS